MTDLAMAHKIITNQTHLEHNRYFTFVRSQRRPYNLLYRMCTTKTENNFFNRVITNWNKLPKSVLEIQSPQKFRNMLKKLDCEQVELNE